MAPKEPIGPQPISDKEVEEALALFDDIPLFMKDLPDDDSNPMIAALQDLAYEGTPDEVATNFKEQGNDYFKGKRYREAVGFYTQAIDAKPTDPKIMTALLSNRAACNIELQNYGSALRDCSKALTLDPRMSKAYYRSAQALLALERFEEALDSCDRCLKVEEGNQGIQVLRAKVVTKKEAKEKIERAREERIKKEQEAKRIMDAAFQERNMISIPKPDGSSNPYQPHWDPEDPTNSTLVLPVFFLYPQYATSDVIPDFVEDTRFAAHLERMFPPLGAAPDWDVKGEYTTQNLVIYAMTRRKRLFKVGKKMTLRDVFKASKAKEGDPKDGMEVKDGCLTFVVVPKGDAEAKWVEEFKNSR